MLPLDNFFQGIRYIAPGVHDTKCEQLRRSYLVDETGIFNRSEDLHDKFASSAAYVCVMSADNKCDALARIIHNGDQGFELERYLDPSKHVPVTERTIEVSEVIIRKDRRGSDPAYKLALGFGRYLKSAVPDTVIGIATEESAPLYARLGFQIHRDISVASYWGMDMYFCEAHPADRIPGVILQETPPLYRAAVGRYLAASDGSN
jgi:hypothetical protein